MRNVPLRTKARRIVSEVRSGENDGGQRVIVEEKFSTY